MKKKFTFISFAIIFAVSLIIIFGFTGKNQIVLKLDINQELHAELVEEENELVAQNEKKLRRSLEKSFINLKISDILEVNVEGDVKKFEARANGVMHTDSGNYNFKTEGVMEEITLSSGKKLLNGSFEGR